MNSISTIHSNEEYSNDYLIPGLPDEVSLQCISNFSCETLLALSLVSKRWNVAVQKDLFFYKCQIRWMNFIFFQSMISIWGNDNQKKTDIKKQITDIIKQIVEETQNDPATFGNLSNSLYSKLLKIMKMVAKSHTKALYLLEPFPNLNRFMQYGCSHLLPLKNAICLSDVNVRQRLKVKSIGKKVNTLILSGAVWRNPIALESLETTISCMKNIRILTWSNIDLRKDNEDQFAFEAFSKILSKIENLKSLFIQEFQVNHMASKNLIILMSSFKKLQSFNFKGKEIGEFQNLAQYGYELRNAYKTSEYSNGDFKIDPDINELYRKIKWKYSRS